MGAKLHQRHHSCSLFLRSLFLCYSSHVLYLSRAQPNITGYTCTSNQTNTTTTNSCHTYAFYRAMAPDFLDLASIGDLFSVSRLMISEPSNISSPSSPLIPDQPLFVPLTCACNTVNSTYSISYANLTYTIKAGNTFYLISTENFQNLTTYQSVEVVNPTLIPTELDIGTDVIFPIFCKCPNETQLQNRVNYLVSYVFQPSDNLSSVASRFGVQTQSITDVNGNNIQPYDTIFIPVTQLPELTQPTTSPSVSNGGSDRKGVVIGLGIGLGICGLLLILACGVLVYREKLLKKREEEEEEGDPEKQKQKLQLNRRGAVGFKDMEVNLMADVSDCLDKYRVFKIEELREATDGFNENNLIHGSVYKGCINAEVYAIKKMKWNAYDELKILQKVKPIIIFIILRLMSPS